ncbi:MAG: xanthine dehydrogenase family protein subunit M [Alphaproteobacteria bacterium]|nr:xanthine dehydrogenase family protein subunit M [Alphaproteobacteria bacterium]
MQYKAPTSVDEAAALLAGASGEARVLAGGTDLLVQLRAAMIAPELIVDVKHIPELTSVSVEDGVYSIGAAAASAELHENADLFAMWPGVIEAMDLVGSTQIQGRASLGGNLCNASPAADSVPAMIAASAVCVIAGPNGTREVPVEDVATGPGQTSLAKGEFVVTIRLPKKAPRTGDAYLRFIPRTEMDIAVVGVGVCLTLDEGGVCTAARVSLGAVAARALLVKDAADALIGTKCDDAAMANLDAAAQAACSPINDKRGTIEFRTKVAGVLARRATAIALERARS